MWVIPNLCISLIHKELQKCPYNQNRHVLINYLEITLLQSDLARSVLAAEPQQNLISITDKEVIIARSALGCIVNP